MKQAIINTGDPRNVLGHIVSGAVAAAVVSGTINYKKVKEGELNKNAAIKDSIKKTSQGAIATGAAIATANYVGQSGGLFKAMTAASIGMLGIYAIEVLDEKLTSGYERKRVEAQNKDLLQEDE